MTSGIICLDKPQGITSFLAVAKIKRIMGIKKAGHAGTLDPMATGVLPVMLSGATRFIDFLPSHEKRYTAGIRLGIETDTFDITGEVIRTSEVFTEQKELEKALEGFRGEIMQVPPMYSAVHVDGQRLYDLARKGIEVEREARKITIKKLELIDFNSDTKEFLIDVEATKGTYIRSLAHDIGEKLGCGAVMTSLRRTMACNFTDAVAVTLEQLENAENVEDYIIPIEKALCHLNSVTISDAQTVRFKNGGALGLSRVKICNPNGIYRVFSPDGTFLGVGEARLENEELAVKKLFVV